MEHLAEASSAQLENQKGSRKSSGCQVGSHLLKRNMMGLGEARCVRLGTRSLREKVRKTLVFYS